MASLYVIYMVLYMLMQSTVRHSGMVMMAMEPDCNQCAQTWVGLSLTHASSKITLFTVSSFVSLW
jgi:hypothetical protein